ERDRHVEGVPYRRGANGAAAHLPGRAVTGQLSAFGRRHAEEAAAGPGQHYGRRLPRGRAVAGPHPRGTGRLTPRPGAAGPARVGRTGSAGNTVGGRATAVSSSTPRGCAVLAAFFLR